MQQYELGKKAKSRRRLYGWLIFSGIVLVSGIVIFSKSYFKANTVVSSPGNPVITTVSDGKAMPRSFDEKLYTMNLPGDWEPATNPYESAAQYGWQNTATEKGTRRLSLYIDTIPVTKALNRYLSLAGQGAQLSVQGNVSDNCINFTQASQINKQTMTAPAKWNGLDFICDAGNYLRDVVGTGSADGINTVKLTGPNSGKHSYFFVYIDNTSQPDYSILTNAVQSFKVK